MSVLAKQLSRTSLNTFHCSGLFYDIKGKGGTKAFTGENFKLKKEENLQLSFQAEDDIAQPSLPMTIRLKSNQDLALQNIYKTFCKFFLSVIPSEYLPYFNETIRWITD